MSFWKEKWYGNEALCVFLPCLFALASLEKVWVKDVWNNRIEGGRCNMMFSRSFTD